MKARLIAGAALFLVAVVSFSYAAGDLWAASFRNAYYGGYIDRAGIMILIATVSLVTSVVLLLGCAVTAIRAKPRAD